MSKNHMVTLGLKTTTDSAEPGFVSQNIEMLKSKEHSKDFGQLGKEYDSPTLPRMKFRR
jgi:hypothetical protein